MQVANSKARRTVEGVSFASAEIVSSRTVSNLTIFAFLGKYFIVALKNPENVGNRYP